MSYTLSYEWSECHASEQPRPQRDGVTIRAIENEKIVPGEYAGHDDDDTQAEREIKTSVHQQRIEGANSANIFEAD